MEFIEFETHLRTKILMDITKIARISLENGVQRIWLHDESYIVLKDGEYDRLKKELESRFMSQKSLNDSFTKLVENGLFIRLPGPVYRR